MAGRDPLVSIVFNGELYNFQELRRELELAGHAFRSQSDTEVIVRAYEEWGQECVVRLRGMFAFVIWDGRTRQMLLARDRVGIKPLYYTDSPGLFAFASEPKALLAHPMIAKRVDPSAVADYFTYGYVPYDKCIFEGIRKLPAGHLMTFCEGQGRLTEYWRFSPESSPSARSPDAATLRSELAGAVRVHMVSDVPIGAFLSGGIDSSIVTALMAGASSSPIHTVSVGFDYGESELPYAREIANRYQTIHHEQIAAVDHVSELLSKLVYAYDEPMADTSTLPTYLLCKIARPDFKVGLSGDGGDELFAGYERYAGMLTERGRSPMTVALLNKLRAVPRLARVQMMLRRVEPDTLRKYQLHVGLFDEWECQRLAGPEVQSAARGKDSLWLFRKFFRADLPLLTALQWLDVKTYLTDDILVKVDRASMAHSLELRPPILDHRIVELAFRIPASQQRSAAGGKSFLKAASLDLLPAPILERRKRGFSPPTRSWFKAALWSIARDRIRSGYCIRDGLVDRSFVDWMVSNGTERRWSKVWAVWFLEEWYRAWIAGHTQ
jgi:asparagine synthase (glutamine-hydrolysing)